MSIKMMEVLIQVGIKILAQRSKRDVQLFEMGHGDIDGDVDIDVIGSIKTRYEGSVFWYSND